MCFFFYAFPLEVPKLGLLVTEIYLTPKAVDLYIFPYVLVGLLLKYLMNDF